jgi:hypothetical protein
MRCDLTAEYVRQILHYDPETGVLRWKERPREHFKTYGSWKTWNTRYSGDSAGRVHRTGYVLIAIGNIDYLAHRLAWIWMTGEWPKEHIDHINGDSSDNRFLNLREATRSENMRNTRRPSTNTSGHKGVSLNKTTNKWAAGIKLYRKKLHIGYFDNIEDAAAAYDNAARVLHGEFARCNSDLRHADESE